MTSVPEVNPGDMVFWHCDVIHAVETEHIGKEDSAGELRFTSFFLARPVLKQSPSVMYIPAVPLTPQNASYIERQLKAFEDLKSPADYGDPKNEQTFVGVGTPKDLVDLGARRAMGLVH